MSERAEVICQHLGEQNNKILSLERTAGDNEISCTCQENTMKEMHEMLLLALSHIEGLSSSTSTLLANIDEAKEVEMEVI